VTNSGHGRSIGLKRKKKKKKEKKEQKGREGDMDKFARRNETLFE